MMERSECSRWAKYALKADGHDQVVEALTRLTEAIGNAQELGDGRREALEQVALISAEAEKPPAERRLGAVKAVLTALQAALSASASLIRVGEFPPWSIETGTQSDLREQGSRRIFVRENEGGSTSERSAGISGQGFR